MYSIYIYIHIHISYLYNRDRLTWLLTESCFPVTDGLYTDHMYEDLAVPVYTTLKGVGVFVTLLFNGWDCLLDGLVTMQRSVLIWMGRGREAGGGGLVKRTPASGIFPRPS